MFWKKKLKSEEYKALLEKLMQVTRRVDLLEVDINLISDKLVKAIQRKAIKKPEETASTEPKEEFPLPEGLLRSKDLEN